MFPPNYTKSTLFFFKFTCLLPAYKDPSNFKTVISSTNSEPTPSNLVPRTIPINTLSLLMHLICLSSPTNRKANWHLSINLSRKFHFFYLYLEHLQSTKKIQLQKIITTLRKLTQVENSPPARQIHICARPK